MLATHDSIAFLGICMVVIGVGFGIVAVGLIALLYRIERKVGTVERNGTADFNALDRGQCNLTVKLDRLISECTITDDKLIAGVASAVAERLKGVPIDPVQVDLIAARVVELWSANANASAPPDTAWFAGKEIAEPAVAKGPTQYKRDDLVTVNWDGYRFPGWYVGPTGDPDSPHYVAVAFGTGRMLEVEADDYNDEAIQPRNRVPDVPASPGGYRLDDLVEVFDGTDWLPGWYIGCHHYEGTDRRPHAVAFAGTISPEGAPSIPYVDFRWASDAEIRPRQAAA